MLESRQLLGRAKRCSARDPQVAVAMPGTRNRGFTLLEVLVSIVLSTILVSILLAALNGMSKSHDEGQSRVQGLGDTRAVIELLRRDLGSAYGGRPNNQGLGEITSATLPGRNTQASEEVVPQRRSALSQRILIPFEANRTKGAIFDPGTRNPTSIQRSIANAHPGNGGGYHKNYDALAFVSRAPLVRQAHTPIDRSITFQGQSLANDALLRSNGDACLVGYYVAFTKNAPLPSAPASMKLFRHFRDSGSEGNRDTDGNRSQGRSYHPIAELLTYSQRPRLEGRIDNRDLPVLLTPVKSYDGTSVIHPWPANPVDRSGKINYTALDKSPPSSVRGGRKPRDRTNADTEALLFSDEPVAFNVIRFKCTPLRRMRDPNTVSTEIMGGAREVNRAFGLNQGAPNEWPVALLPHVVRIELVVLDDATASVFTTRKDWENWESIPYLRALVERESYTIETLIRVGQEH